MNKLSTTIQQIERVCFAVTDEANAQALNLTNTPVSSPGCFVSWTTLRRCWMKRTHRIARTPKARLIYTCLVRFRSWFESNQSRFNLRSERKFLSVSCTRATVAGSIPASLIMARHETSSTRLVMPSGSKHSISKESGDPVRYSYQRAGKFRGWSGRTAYGSQVANAASDTVGSTVSIATSQNTVLSKTIPYTAPSQSHKSANKTKLSRLLSYSVKTRNQ